MLKLIRLLFNNILVIRSDRNGMALRAPRVSETGTGHERTIALKPEDSEEFDMGLYLMEHFDVEGVTIHVSAHRLEISGRVDLMDNPREFKISWTK